jgi:hypothetical protein
VNQEHEPSRIQQEGRTVEVRQEAVSCKVKPTKSEVEKRRGEPVASLAKEYEVSIATIYRWFRPRTCIAPSVYNAWVMAEYRREIKRFPDWGSIWSSEVERRKDRERWGALLVEERRDRNKRNKPKDMVRRNFMLNEARKRRMEQNPHIRTVMALRARFRKLIKGGRSKSVSTLLGCSLPELKKHLDSQFTKGMSWDNYGTRWHIDHILPCASFDHTDEKQMAQCWHWTNLRPLDATENMRKRADITEPQMSLLIDYAA